MVSFTEPVPIQPLIDNNSIAGIFTIRDNQEAAVSLTNPSFAYDAALRTLNVTWSNPLAPGDYSFSINTSGFTDAAGSKLSPGLSGAFIRVRDNSAGSPVKANGTDIVAFEAHPVIVDLNGDSKNDLIVGERIATGQSKVRFYRNSGTATNPVFDNPVYLQGVDGDLIISDNSSQFRFHDWNGDGELDLTVGRSDGRIEIWTNINTTADAIFGVPRFVTSIAGSVATQIDVGNQATPEWVDWNNDGRKDLIVSSEDGYLCLFVDQATRGAPRFTASSYVMLGNARIKTPNSKRVSTGDLNGDGRFDIVVGTGGMLIYYPNVGTLGSPRFVGGWQMGLSGLPDHARDLSSDLADLNGDGQSDIVVGTAAGLISFHPMQVSTTQLSNRSLVSAEVNDRITHLFSVVSQNSKKWQNPLNPLDVNSDGIVAPQDVLTIINYINAQPGPLPISFQSPYLDVDGDDLITPLYVLIVINFINANSVALGEPENGRLTTTKEETSVSTLNSAEIGYVDSVFMNELDDWSPTSCGCALKGSSPILMGRNIGNQFQSSAEEQYPCSIVFKVPEATSCTFNRLDATVEAFAHGVGDAMSYVGKNSFNMAFVGPRSGYRQDSASFALRARKRGVNRCRELHGVQVSPRALWSQVCLRTIAFALRTLMPRSAKADMNINGLLFR